MKRLLSCVMSLFVLSFSLLVPVYANTLPSHNKTVVDFDNKTTSVTIKNNAYSVVDYSTIDSSYTDGKALKLTIEQWQSAYIMLPKNWKEGSPVGLSYTLISGTDTTLTQAAVGMNNTTTGNPYYSVSQMGNAITGNKSIPAGTSYEMFYDLSLVDTSKLNYTTYICFKTEQNTTLYVDNIKLYYENSSDVPQNHDVYESLEDFENGVDSVVAVNTSGNSGFGGNKSLSTTAYEGTGALKAGKNCWDNQTGSGYLTHFAANYVKVPVDAEKMEKAYDVSLFFKMNSGSSYYGVTINGVDYWNTTGFTSTAWSRLDFLYSFYSFYYKDGSGNIVRDDNQGIYLTPDNIADVTSINIGTSTHVSNVYALVDSIQYSLNCTHTSYTVISSHEADCDFAARQFVRCDDCAKEFYIYDETKPALGHIWVKGETVAPVGATPGYTVYTCERCNTVEHRDLVYLDSPDYSFVAATNQIPDNTGTKSFYYPLYSGSIPTTESNYTDKATVSSKLPYVTNATYSRGVGTFYDETGGHCLTFGRTSPAAVNDFITLSFNVKAGRYNLYTFARSNSGRGTYKVTASAGSQNVVLDTAYKQNKSADSGDVLSKNDLGYLVVGEDTTIDLTFTLVATGSFFLKAVVFDGLAEIPTGITPKTIGYNLDSNSFSTGSNKFVALAEASIPAVGTLMPNGKRFVALKANNTLKSSGSVVAGEYEAFGLEFKVLEGAGVRIKNDGTNGIRFLSAVNKSDYDALINAGAVVSEIATRIGPSDYFGVKNDEDFAIAKATAFYSTENHSGTDYYIIAGSLINIKTANYTRSFLGQGFLSFTIDNEKVSIDANYDISNNSRSVRYVATKALEDTSANYTSEQIEILKTYAGV